MESARRREMLGCGVHIAPERGLLGWGVHRPWDGDFEGAQGTGCEVLSRQSLRGQGSGAGKGPPVGDRPGGDRPRGTGWGETGRGGCGPTAEPDPGGHGR